MLASLKYPLYRLIGGSMVVRIEAACPADHGRGPSEDTLGIIGWTDQPEKTQDGLAPLRYNVPGLLKLLPSLCSRDVHSHNHLALKRQSGLTI